jgi:hypothetical protein
VPDPQAGCSCAGKKLSDDSGLLECLFPAVDPEAALRAESGCPLS